MKRWNGWGSEAFDYHVPEQALRYLQENVGPGVASIDVRLEEILKNIPEPRGVDHFLVRTDSRDRVLHARGQSLPDWVALRSGRIEKFPDGVAYPGSVDEIRRLLSYARTRELCLIPYGGGTSVVGHINPLPGDQPVITVDMARFDRLESFDEASGLASFGAGLPGPSIESLLRAHKYTLGHFPQSWEYSTLGGWIATRSSGQQSYHYGRIEDLYAGGHMETPTGPLDLPPFPASAAGPDLRHLVLGSEGRLGFITHATMRVMPLPEREIFLAAFFHDWADGVEMVRQVARGRIPVSMLRLGDQVETGLMLALAGKTWLVDAATRGLDALGFGGSRSLLIYGLSGDRDSVNLSRFQVESIARSHGALLVPVIIGQQWNKTRFLTPYLRNALWGRGYAVDTLETAIPWSGVVDTASAIKSAMSTALAEEGERILVFAHLSHVYEDGASVYITYIFRRSADPDVLLARWRKLKGAASQVIIKQGGTISHQHGVGTDHAPYLPAEKGQVGIALLRGAFRTLDPGGIMNPGKLLEGA